MAEIDFTKLPDQKKVDFSALPDQKSGRIKGAVGATKEAFGAAKVRAEEARETRLISKGQRGVLEKRVTDLKAKFDAGQISQEEFETKTSKAKERLGEVAEKSTEAFAATARAGVEAIASPLTGAITGGFAPEIEKVAEFGSEQFQKLSSKSQQKVTGVLQKISEIADEHPVLRDSLATLTEAFGLATLPGFKQAGQKVFKDTLGQVKNFTQKSGRVIELPKIGEAKPFVKDTLNITDVSRETAAPSKSFRETINKATENLLFADLKDPTDISFRAIKPRIIKGVNLKKVKDNLKLANQTIADFGFKPTSVKEYVDAIDASKRKVWAQIEDKISNSDLRANLDLTEVALKLLKKAEDPALLKVNPKGARQIEEFAENLVRVGGDVNVVEGEKIKQLLNAQLDDAFGQTDLSKPLKEAMKQTTRDIGVQLDSILSDIPDEFAALKRQYGALRGIEDDAVKRMIVFERQNPEDLISSLTKIQAVGDLVFGSTGERAKAVQRLGVSKIIKDRNDANKMIQRAFSLIKAKPKTTTTTSPRIAIPPLMGQGTP